MPSKIYVSGLPADVRSSELEDVFSKYGTINRVDIKSEGRSPFAFIEFEGDNCGEDAVKGEESREFSGRQLRVEMAKSRTSGGDGERRESKYGPPKRTDYRVEVSHLPYRCSWQDLKDHMRKEGEVGYCTVHGDVGTVEYLHYDDMKHAIKYLDDTKIRSGGESSYIRIYRSREDSRRNSRSRSRSRSRSYRQSNSKRSNSRSRSHSQSPQKDSRSGSRSGSKK